MTKKEKALNAANKFLQKGQLDKAISQYERVLAIDDRDPRLRHKYAELLARKGRAKDAMEEFRWVAAYYEQGGFYPKAIAVYKQMLGMEPDRTDIHLHLGEIYRQQGKHSDAAYHFRTVASKVEKDGALEDKVAVYEKLVRINPDDFELRMSLIDLYANSSMAGKAVEALQELAAGLRGRGDTEALLGVLDRRVGVADDPLPYLKEIASIHLDRRVARRALSKLQECFKIDPQDEETLLLLGRAFADLGKKHKALQVFEELIRIYGEANNKEKLREIEARVREIAPESRPATPEDTGSVPTIPLDLPEDVPDEALRAIVHGEVFVKYGLEERAKTAVHDVIERWPNLFASHALQARYMESAGDLAAAAAAVMQMYTVAMDVGDLPVARRCLVETVRLLPDDPSAEGRVAAFDEAMGDQLKVWESRQVLEQTDEIRVGEPSVDFPGAAPAGEDYVEVQSQTQDPDVESLDGESVEMLPDEQLLSELASGSFAAAPPPPPPAPAAEDDSLDASMELEISDDSSLSAPGGESTLETAHDEDDPDTIDDEISLEASTPDPDDDFDSMISEMASAIEGEVAGPAPAAPDADGGDNQGLDLGLGYYEVGLYAEALAELETARAGGAAPDRALLYIGRCHRQLNQLDDAVERLQEALEAGGRSGPLQTEILFELASTFEAKGDVQVAHDTFAEVVRLDPAFRDGEASQRQNSLAAGLGFAED